jgi:hypothetical protein
MRSFAIGECQDASDEPGVSSLTVSYSSLLVMIRYVDERIIAESLVEPSERDPGFRAVDRQLFSYPLIDISARVRRGDTCSPRTLPAQDSAALSGSMILEQMAGFAWNRQQHLLEPATTTA